MRGTVFSKLHALSRLFGKWIIFINLAQLLLKLTNKIIALQMGLKESLLKIEFIKNIKRNQQKKRFKGSAEYWEDRYKAEGNSGSGSYDHLANFKAQVLNDFVAKNKVNTVLEFGCGDGNQLTIAKYPNYIGLDVSPTAIQMCHKRFKDDKTKSFLIYNSLAFFDNHQIVKADLTMSLDVLYHLVEIEIFEKYIIDLFNASQKYVIIYASDYNQEEEPIHQHENRRGFTAFVAKQFPNFKLVEVIKNKYPKTVNGLVGSYSDFFIYEKQ
jgi:cyclopropane fatty-acyl-phospholipid synthase-like methyltransferase